MSTDELNKVQSPTLPFTPPNISASSADSLGEFPNREQKERLAEYEYYEKLFLGDHWTAFNIKIGDDDYSKEYSKIRYVKANFAGLISKIIADMLFSEPVTVKVPKGDQDFVDALWKTNNMDTQLYESALSNSYLGDGLFKLRIDKRMPNDEKSSIIIEEMTPTVYFPEIDPFNVRAFPKRQTLMWAFNKGDKKYLRKEIHEIGTITNELYLMENEKIVEKLPLTALPETADLKPEESTNIDIPLIYHVPNWKTGNRYFGISDYYDLDTLFYAINNRLSKVDNILDKHSDPILMVPPGVLDEKGQVKKKALGVVEVQNADDGKPEYIVWDASLDNAFKEIEKLVEFTYLMGEISPDILGVGQGVSDSGRALKFKLMRTIAKAARKKLYYDRAIKEIIFAAQVLAKEWNLEVDGMKLKGEPTKPEIDWADGLPIDNGEQIDNETKAIEAGLTSKKDAIMRIYGVDEESAEEKLEEMKKEDEMMMPAIPTGVGAGAMATKGAMPPKAAPMMPKVPIKK